MQISINKYRLSPCIYRHRPSVFCYSDSSNDLSWTMDVNSIIFDHSTERPHIVGFFVSQTTELNTELNCNFKWRCLKGLFHSLTCSLLFNRYRISYVWKEDLLRQKDMVDADESFLYSGGKLISCLLFEINSCRKNFNMFSLFIYDVLVSWTSCFSVDLVQNGILMVASLDEVDLIFRKKQLSDVLHCLRSTLLG